MSLLAGSIQPQFMTLLSSTSIPALSPLFTCHTEKTNPKSLIYTTEDTPGNVPSSSTSIHESSKGCLAHQVIHIQSPNVQSTYIQAGLSNTIYRAHLDKGKGREIPRPLGIELPWVGIQARGLGARDWGFEIGIIDDRGREGIVRCSTFKTEPTLHPYRMPPLIHLPLQTPKITPTTLTPWLDISINLSSMILLFSTLPRGRHKDDAGERKAAERKIQELPAGRFASVTYVRVYANCRVRRIWFSAEGEKTLRGMGRGVEEEWGLYAASSV